MFKIIQLFVISFLLMGCKSTHFCDTKNVSAKVDSNVAKTSVNHIQHVNRDIAINSSGIRHLADQMYKIKHP